MAVKVSLPYAFGNQISDNAEIELEGLTVREIFEELIRIYPAIKPLLFDARGNPRNFVNIYVGAEDIRALEGLDTRVVDGSEISIVPAIAGGPGTDIDISGKSYRDAYVDVYVQDTVLSQDAIRVLQAS